MPPLISDIMLDSVVGATVVVVVVVVSFEGSCGDTLEKVDDDSAMLTTGWIVGLGVRSEAAGELVLNPRSIDGAKVVGIVVSSPAAVLAPDPDPSRTWFTFSPIVIIGNSSLPDAATFSTGLLVVVVVVVCWVSTPSAVTWTVEVDSIGARVVLWLVAIPESIGRLGDASPGTLAVSGTDAGCPT